MTATVRFDKWENTASTKSVTMDQIAGGSGLVPIVPPIVTLGSGTSSVNASGMVTFSGATYVRLRDIFTATYRNYMVIVSDINTPAGNSYAYVQLNSNNTDNNSSYYTESIFVQVGTAVSAYNVNSGPAWDIGPTNAGNEYFGSSIDIYSPAATTYTKATFQSNCGTGGVSSVNGGLLHANTSAFSGLTLFAASNAAFSGNIQVYGYR